MNTSEWMRVYGRQMRYISVFLMNDKNLTKIAALNGKTIDDL